MQRMSELNDYYREIKDCKRCRLNESRTNFVFGDGSESANLMFVGEAPGRNEDQQGKPFVGAAGQLLNDLLAGINLKREDVYIANIIKSRPPGNRDPLPDEIEACKPYLMKQIEIIKPKIIATLGAHATRTMLEESVSIGQVHGQTLKDKNGLTIMPIYHPAAALYNRSTIDVLKQDFENLRTLLDKESVQQETESSKSAEDDFDQGTLF